MGVFQLANYNKTFFNQDKISNILRTLYEGTGGYTAMRYQKIFDKDKKAEDFDLILMDVQMPIMNGYESTAAIRAMGINIPIIGLTANVYKEDIEKCIESGMNAHLGKPFTEADLFNELKKWLA
jgi:CheY-like chemotaxis protein